MDFMTWNDLIQIATLILTAIACFRNNKKDNRRSYKLRGYLF